MEIKGGGAGEDGGTDNSPTTATRILPPLVSVVTTHMAMLKSTLSASLTISTQDGGSAGANGGTEVCQEDVRQSFNPQLGDIMSTITIL